MIVPDLNLLIYAHDPDSPVHESAQRWWTGLLDSVEPVGLPWTVLTGFMRLMSNPATVNPSWPPALAARTVDSWLQHPHVAAIEPGPNHAQHLVQLLDSPDAGPNTVADAHIAALAAEYDAVVHSRDRDFQRFPSVRWHNPIAPPELQSDRPV